MYSISSRLKGTHRRREVITTATADAAAPFIFYDFAFQRHSENNNQSVFYL